MAAPSYVISEGRVYRDSVDASSSHEEKARDDWSYFYAERKEHFLFALRVGEEILFSRDFQGGWYYLPSRLVATTFGNFAAWKIADGGGRYFCDSDEKLVSSKLRELFYRADLVQHDNAHLIGEIKVLIGIAKSLKPAVPAPAPAPAPAVAPIAAPAVAPAVAPAPSPAVVPEQTMMPVTEFNLRGNFLSVSVENATYEGKVSAPFSSSIEAAYKKKRYSVRSVGEAGDEVLILTFEIDDEGSRVVTKLKRQKVIVQLDAERELIYRDTILELEPDWKVLEEFAVGYRYLGITDSAAFEREFRYCVKWSEFSEEKYATLRTKPESTTEEDMRIMSQKLYLNNVRPGMFMDSEAMIKTGQCESGDLGRWLGFVKDCRYLETGDWKKVLCLHKLVPLYLSYFSWRGFDHRQGRWWISRKDRSTFSMQRVVVLNRDRPNVVTGDPELFASFVPSIDRPTKYWSVKFDMVTCALITETYKK